MSKYLETTIICKNCRFDGKVPEEIIKRQFEHFHKVDEKYKK